MHATSPTAKRIVTILALLAALALVGCDHAPPPDPAVVSAAAPAPLLPGECYAPPVAAPLLPEDHDVDDIDAAFDALAMGEALAAANGQHAVCRAALAAQFGTPPVPAKSVPVASPAAAPELGAHQR
jgi:hypothetical protein